MKYKVLYRKYRPDDFENIVGQDYIIKTLKNSIINNNISHAYLFSGPRGTGKTSTAKVFAKAINCANPENGSPCGKCEFCLNFKENPDIIELDAASNNGVDEIREIIENIKITPTNGKYKVYIIDEVHMLTQSAFNALLLTLEEPPAHAVFILATTNVENVPITILSRCQRFDFQKIKPSVIVERAKKICADEGIKIEDAALEEIAYLSEGGMRDALSLLDQLSKNKDLITLDLVESQFKTVSKKNIEDLIDYVEKNDVNSCLNLINEFKNKAVDYKNLVKKIIDVASVRAKNIVVSNKIERLSISDYKKLILNLIDSLNKINVNVDSYTILEMILLEFFNSPSISRSIPADEVKMEPTKEPEEIQVIEEKNQATIKENAKATGTTEATEALINLRINNCFAKAQKNYLEQAKKEMEEVEMNVNIPGKIKSILLDSDVVTASPNNLIFKTNDEHTAPLANQMLKEIEQFLQKILNKNYKIIFLTSERWDKEKAEYIKNLKNKKAYEYIEEKEEPVDKEEMVSDVFDLSKVEIV